MMKQSTSTRFQIVGRIVALVGVDVPAKTMDEALDKSKELKVEDFITIDGDHQDSSLVISSISKHGTWDTEQ
jgi:hypothetical protein